MMAYIFGSIWDRFNRNALNALSKSVEQQGVSIQELVAKGQLTPEQYATLIQYVNGLVSKGDISVFDINKELGKFDASFFTHEFLESISNSTINIDTTNVLNRSITQEKIKKDAVGDNELAIVETGKNLIDLDATQKGVLINSSGTIGNNANHDVTGYIPVFSGVSYSFWRARNLAIWTPENEFYEFYDNPGSGALTMQFPISGYIRVGFNKAFSNEVQVERSASVTNYESFNRKIKHLIVDGNGIERESIGNGSYKNKSISSDKTDFIETSSNLINPEKVNFSKMWGWYNNSELRLTDSPTYNASHPIKMRQGDKVTVSRLRDYSFINLKNERSQSSSEIAENITITALEDGNLYFNYFQTDQDTIQAEYGTQSTAYEPYVNRLSGVDVDGKDLINGSVTSDKLPNKSITAEKTDFIKIGKNLLNPEDVHLSKLWGWSGTNMVLLDSATYHASPKWEMKKGDQITISSLRNFTFTDSNGERSVTGSEGYTDFTFTAETDGTLHFSFFKEDLSSLQIEWGDRATSYEPYKGKYLDESINVIGAGGESPSTVSNGNYSITKRDGTIIMTTELDGKELRFESEQYGSANDGFNFISTAYDGTHIHSTHDDITPVRTFNTVGANHGYTSIVSLPNTNKVTADLGSVWTDGANEFVLLRIVGGRLIFSVPYTENSKGIVNAPNINPSADLTHVRNATNTQSISIKGVTATQLYPSTGKVLSQYKVDGKVINDDGVYSGDEVTITDSYDILDYKAIVEWAKSNVGKDYANSRNSIDGVLRISNTYQYHDYGKCRTSHSIYALKNVSMNRTGVLQSQAIQHPSMTVYRYAHNVDTINGINFKTPINLSTYSTNCNVTRENLIDSSKPVDRYVDYIGSGSNKLIAFTMGHVIDKTNSKHADRMANIPNVFWDFRSTKKSYPTVLEGKVLQAGDYYNFQGFRDYYIPKSSTLNSNVSSDKSVDYIYIDEQSSGSFKAVKDDSLIGKELELIDSRNFELLSDVADSQGIPYRTTGSNSYGVIKAK